MLKTGKQIYTFVSYPLRKYQLFLARSDNMSGTELLTIIENNQLFSGLDILEKEKIPHIADKLILVNNQAIVPHYIVKDSIFIVCKGEAVVIKQGNDNKTIRELLPGDIWFGGELDKKNLNKIHIQCSPKSIVWVIRLSDLFYQVEFRRIHSKISQNLGLTVTGERSEHHHYLWLFNRDEIEHRLISMQYFITTTLLILCMYIFFLHLSPYFADNEVLSVSITLFFTLLCAGAFSIMLKESDFSPAVVGLTLTNTRAALAEALLGAIPLILATMLIKWLLIMIFPNVHSTSFFGFKGSLAEVGGIKGYLYTIIIYVFLSIPLQELVFRGGIQGYLQQLFAGRKTMWQPIILANIVFSTTNLIVSPYLALFSFIPGFYWGWLFAKHNNLIGVCISHAIFAITAFFIIT